METSAFQKLTAEYQDAQPYWRVAKAFFDSHTLTEHQIESYNLFMREKLPLIISNTEFEYLKDNYSHVVNFDNVYIKRPEYTETSGIQRKLIPHDCRIRNLNYMCDIFADITQYTIDDEGKTVETKTDAEVFLGAIPCMVLSEYCNLRNKDLRGKIKNYECPKDPGGYFIINGTEKVLMSQDRMAHNEIFVFKSKEKDTIKLPEPDSDKNSNRPCAWSAEVRSYSTSCEPNISSTYIKLSAQQLDKGEDQRLYVEVPGLKAPIPWPILFKALGVIDAEEMTNYVADADDLPMITLLMSSLDCEPINTQQEALTYLSKFVLTTQKDQRMKQLKRILRRKLFQNVTSTEMKRYYLGHMTHQLLATALGRRKEDDRDHYGKKRVDSAGSLINNLFKSVWKRIIREVTNNLNKRRVDLAQVFYGKITNYIKPPFATGNWTAIKTNTKTAKVGISQALNRHNYISTISAIRRVVTPNDKEKNNKVLKPRHLHNSQWFMLCPVETPEGQPTGLIKNLAMMTAVSLGSAEEQIIDWLKMDDSVQFLKDIDINLLNMTGQTKIFINGTWQAITNKAPTLERKLRRLKRKGKLPFEVSISIGVEGLRIYTDEGRLMCPFFVVEKGQLRELPEEFTWQELLEKGIIEYLDTSELESVKHSVFPWKIRKDDSYAVIHPSLMFGISGNTATFAAHNQSPRIIYQSSMGKQALGVSSTNFLHRYDTNAHILTYPQKPLVNTATMRLVGSEELPSGQNLIVAVMSAGYNQEDSVIINQRALDNGALRSTCYTTYSESNHRKGNVFDEIKRPEKLSVKETRLKGYNKLDSDGISKEGTPLAKRDVVIGKVNSSPDMVRDTSVVIKTNGMEDDAVLEVNKPHSTFVVKDGSAVVDQALLTLNMDSFKTNKVRVRQMRVPKIGDKVASRLAQKGIIGMILPPEDMPFAEKTGMSPDLIMNPHAFPSRMTVGQPLETFLGKACSLNGATADCSAYNSFDHKTVAEELRKYGFEATGEERLINGMTGDEIPCTIFMGPTYYQRLKHMVDDKIHARDQDGPRETLTRQPVEGRKRGGGFRMGEMETWCGISHGASLFLIDRLVNNSDGYEMFVCNYCGNTAIATIKTQRYECKRCQQNTAISKIRIPYAFKLLMQELQACGIGVWFNINSNKKLVAGPTPSH